jgi:hypothetical protein
VRRVKDSMSSAPPVAILSRWAGDTIYHSKSAHVEIANPLTSTFPRPWVIFELAETLKLNARREICHRGVHYDVEDDSGGESARDRLKYNAP